jgi:hypothetical protein
VKARTVKLTHDGIDSEQCAESSADEG